MLRHPVLAAALVLGALTLTPSLACAAKQPGAELVDRAMGTSDHASAVATLEGALAAASDDAAPWIALNAGELRRLLDEPKLARRHFQKAAKAGGDTERAAELGLALLDASSKGVDAARAELLGVSEKVALDTQNADRFYYLAVDAATAGDAAQTATFTRKSLKYAGSDPLVEARIRAWFDRLAGGPDEPAPAESGGSLLERLDAAVAAGDRGRVERLAGDLAAAAEAESDDALIAAYAVKRLDMPLDSQRIAVLLPLSGKYKGVGAQIQKAVKMGFMDGGGTKRLVFIDTGEDATSAVAALERAVLQEGAVAVVGPLRSDVAAPVARAANALRVPLIGLHQDTTAADDRPWILDGLSTPEPQVERLVAYAMDTRGMDSFAIFAPDNPYGHAAADAFTAEVEGRGGAVTVREHYDPDATDLIPFAKKLGRKDYEARRSEFYKVKQEIERQGGDPSKAVLPPIIDFDAIFLPDSRRRIPVAAAGLAYEEFPIGDFKIKRDGRTIPLLGLSGWNHDELISTGGPYVRHSVFVDVWVPKSAEARSFVRDYQAATTRAPSGLEAQSWTVGRVLAAATRGEAATREELRNALLTASLDTPTATGAQGIDADKRRVSHEVRVLTLTKDGIRELRPPPPAAPE